MKKRDKHKKKNKRSRGLVPVVKELRLDDLKSIIERAKTSPLNAEEIEKLTSAVDTLAFLTRELEGKGASIRRLRNMIFGPSTEKTSAVVGEAAEDASRDVSSTASDADTDKKEKKPKGHGRNGADAYLGAERVTVLHETLKRGDACPECPKGKVYPLSKPAVLVRVRGMAPLQATVYEVERLRCNLCGEVFQATAPEGVGEAKYDETAASMIGLLKYGSGLPFNRIERLEQGLGIPLPAATQWEVVHRVEENFLAPAYRELVRQAAQGEILYNDDTTMKILDIAKENQRQAASDEPLAGRTGIFTSGVVSTGCGHKIALFFTGRQHAGENLSDVLSERAAALSPPIQMCDALARNTTGEFDTLVANCIAHARRRFVDVADNFPAECRHVLETLREVYTTDAACRKKNMSPEERLFHHQLKSGPLMGKLKSWLQDGLDEHKVEPNSGLGEAVRYMLKHWDKLTLFLRVPGAPLDNNLCERALKKAILHRKNSLFYKTRNGARVGDTFMSLIHTSELCKVNPFDYLVELQRNQKEVAENPGDWMPWNYKAEIRNAPAGTDNER